MYISQSDTSGTANGHGIESADSTADVRHGCGPGAPTSCSPMPGPALLKSALIFSRRLPSSASHLSNVMLATTHPSLLAPATLRDACPQQIALENILGGGASMPWHRGSTILRSTAIVSSRHSSRPVPGTCTSGRISLPTRSPNELTQRAHPTSSPNELTQRAHPTSAALSARSRSHA